MTNNGDPVYRLHVLWRLIWVYNVCSILSVRILKVNSANDSVSDCRSRGHKRLRNFMEIRSTISAYNVHSVSITFVYEKN